MWSLGDFVLYGGLTGMGILSLCGICYWGFSKRKRLIAKNHLEEAFITTN